MPFNITEFLKQPTPDKVRKARKSELVAIATELNLDINQSMRKQELLNNIVNFYVEEEIFPEDTFNALQEKENPTCTTDQLNINLKMKELELQQRRMEMEMEQKRMDHELKMKQMEQGTVQNLHDSRSHFDVAKNIKLVPPFQEYNVDQFFTHF